jgi:hypothetical protein
MPEDPWFGDVVTVVSPFFDDRISRAVPRDTADAQG